MSVLLSLLVLIDCCCMHSLHVLVLSLLLLLILLLALVILDKLLPHVCSHPRRKQHETDQTSAIDLALALHINSSLSYRYSTAVTPHTLLLLHSLSSSTQCSFHCHRPILPYTSTSRHVTACPRLLCSCYVLFYCWALCVRCRDCHTPLHLPRHPGPLRCVRG